MPGHPNRFASCLAVGNLIIDIVLEIILSIKTIGLGIRGIARQKRIVIGRTRQYYGALLAAGSKKNQKEEKVKETGAFPGTYSRGHLQRKVISLFFFKLG